MNPSFPRPTTISESPSAPYTSRPIPEEAEQPPRVPLQDEPIEIDARVGKPDPKKNNDAESDEDEDDGKEHDLDTHVRRILSTTRKAQIQARLKGLWAFLKTPMGVIVGIYGFLVVFWGAAIVIFLAGWIPMNSTNTKDIWVGTSSLCSTYTINEVTARWEYW